MGRGGKDIAERAGLGAFFALETLCKEPERWR